MVKFGHGMVPKIRHFMPMFSRPSYHILENVIAPSKLKLGLDKKLPCMVLTGSYPDPKTRHVP